MKPFYNDQAHIAEEFQYWDKHITQVASLAYFKIQSYKLSLIRSSFNITRDELAGNLRCTLLQYRDAAGILADTGFFEAEVDN